MKFCYVHLASKTKMSSVEKHELLGDIIEFDKTLRYVFVTVYT